MNAKTSRFFRLFRRRTISLAMLSMGIVLGGCQLYGPSRYQRPAFAPGAPTTRVLMIGDSLTYYNDLPGLLQQFSMREASPIYIEQITIPLASLKFHWDLGRAAKRIREGHWDYVVLQEFSREPLTNPRESLKYFSLFDGEIRRAGGKTIVFENWTRRGRGREYAALSGSYGQIINQTQGIFAPIGTVWLACTQLRPDIRLLVDDRHPTDAGSYLAACVLYDVLYHKPAAALPLNIAGPDLPTSEKQALRGCADETLGKNKSTIPN